MLLERTLDRHPVRSLAQYREAGGGRAIDAARRVEPDAVIDAVTASGLRGRGGAGFPTGVKWRTVVDNASTTVPTTVVVNAAEGEPGTFKDRMLLRTSPYKVLEGALVAAHAVGATDVVVGIKASFEREVSALAVAISEMEAAGLTGDTRIRLLPGPGEYLFGEETALLEVLEGRQPFPRVVPPFRRGVDDTDVGPTSSSTEMATPDAGGGAPTLANNVETLANVPRIVLDGPEEFRRLGTPDSPGTIVCTVTGRTARHGVGEVEMGTPLGEMIEAIGGGAAPERTLTGAISGTANAIVPAELFDTPLTHEAMREIGSGLGAAGYVVVDDSTDMVAFAHGISRFLAVESCGQCEPCKSDGLALAELLDALRRSDASGGELDEVRARLGTVGDNARCSLASQQESVVGSILTHFPAAAHDHAAGTRGPAPLDLIAPITDIRDGRAVLDESQLTKQPDWSHDAPYSGAWPAASLADTPVSVRPPPLVTPDDGRDERTAATEGAALPSLDALHDEVSRELDDLPAPPCPQRTGCLERLADSVRVYHDVTERVLYPLARRKLTDADDAAAGAAVGGTGDMAMDLARTDRRESEELLAQMLASPGSDHRPQVHDMVGALRDQIALDREVLMPELRSTLSDQELRDLDDALEEARLTSLEGAGARA